MPILPLFILLFIGVPLIEIYLLIEVGSIIGALSTVFAVLFTAVLGVTLIRIQGFSTLQKAQNSMNKGTLPATEMFEGLMLLFAALCLLIPGFFTDGVGFLLLIPPLRAFIATKIIKSTTLNSRMKNGFQGGFGQGASQGDFFEGEYEDLTPEQQHQRNQEKLQHQHLFEGTVEDDSAQKERPDREN